MKTSQDSIAFGYRGSAMTIIETNVPLPGKALPEDLAKADELIDSHKALCASLIADHNALVYEAHDHAMAAGRTVRAQQILSQKVQQIED